MRPQPLKVNMTVAEATTFVTKRRESLGPNEELLTENQDTHEVDMLFSKSQVITPNDPWYLKGNMLTTEKPIWSGTGNSAKTKKAQPRTARGSKRNSKSKWIPNMRRMKTSDLRAWLRNKSNGTPKQRSLASSIIRGRN